jgi:hypothetical protein
MGLAKRSQKGNGPKRLVMVPSAEERRPLGITLGIIFGIIGGIIIASSAMLAWVQTSASGQVIYTYLSGLLDRGGIYYAVLLIPLAGIVTAVLSALELLGVRGFERLRRYSPSGALVSAVIAAVALILVANAIDGDYIATGSSIYGAAVVLSVFGIVLAVAGGMVMTIDQMVMGKHTSKFRTGAGDERLMRALRPAPKRSRTRDTSLAKSKDRELRDEIRASDETRTAKEEKCQEAETCCPRCGTPIEDDPVQCPGCGARLR